MSNPQPAEHDGDCILVFPTLRDKACIGHRLIPLLSGSKNVFLVRLREGETADEVVGWAIGPRAMGKLPVPNGPRWSGFDWSWSAWCARESDDRPCPMQPLWFDESSLMEGVAVHGTIVVRPDNGSGFSPGCLASLIKKYFRTMPVSRR
jgi:hypothetical protein